MSAGCARSSAQYSRAYDVPSGVILPARQSASHASTGRPVATSNRARSATTSTAESSSRIDAATRPGAELPGAGERVPAFAAPAEEEHDRAGARWVQELPESSFELADAGALVLGGRSEEGERPSGGDSFTD